MRKVISITAAVLLILSIASCGSPGSVTLSGDEDITMETIDQYLNADARFVDVRDYNDMMSAGYIAGFEVVPFFQYLEGRALVRNDGWNFTSADLINAAILENVFGPKDRAIVIMCASGGRAGYVTDALRSIGYTTVFNAGGIRDYAGENLVLGDGVYNGLRVLPAEVTMANIDQYRDRPGAKYVDLRNVSDQYEAGYIDGFEFISFFEYLDGRALVRNNGWDFSEADIQNELILENIFGDDRNREIFIMCGSGARAGYVTEALRAMGYTTVFNVGGIADYAGNHRIFGDETFDLVLR